MMPPGWIDLLALFDVSPPPSWPGDIGLIRHTESSWQLVGIIKAKTFGNTKEIVWARQAKNLCLTQYSRVLFYHHKKNLCYVSSKRVPCLSSLELSHRPNLWILSFTTLSLIPWFSASCEQNSVPFPNPHPGLCSSSFHTLAVIEEGNRLSFGVTARTARIAHESLTYTPSLCVAAFGTSTKSYIIPAETPENIECTHHWKSLPRSLCLRSRAVAWWCWLRPPKVLDGVQQRKL